MHDLLQILVLGSGPAALCIAAELRSRGISVEVVSPESRNSTWKNIYGIWADELEAFNLDHLLKHRWTNTVSYFGAGGSKDENRPTEHSSDYGLIDRAEMQRYLLDRCGNMNWHEDIALSIKQNDSHSEVVCDSGKVIKARLVIDASGYQSKFILRQNQNSVAVQTAYGIVGRFNHSPVDSGQFVLMDFRTDHLTTEQRSSPPTFLYAMDLGNGVFFVEETSLALDPPLPKLTLKHLLETRLKHRDSMITEVIHEEHSVIPMNLPLPVLHQPILAFGGSASMVHPASGYMVGSLFRRAPELAETLAIALALEPLMSSRQLAQQGWSTLWPREQVLRRYLFQFGIDRLMGYDERLLRSFFSSFFALPNNQWSRYLTNTMPLPGLLGVMFRTFLHSPWDLRFRLVLG